MTGPVVLGVVGDSGAGKTTLVRGIARVLGEERMSTLSGDDYHRYDRRQRRELGITPLHPRANHLDILEQHLVLLRSGQAILKPVYDHRTGTLQPPVYLRPRRYLLVNGLLLYHTEALRAAHDIRVFVAPPQELRRAWKLKRDCTRRGYTTDDVLAELDRREADAGRFLRPQERHADIVVSFHPDASGQPDRLDADLILRDTLHHPDFSSLLGSAGGPTLEREEGAVRLRIPGSIDPRQAMEIEEEVWSQMQFASHLRLQRLGEFTVGTDLRRSESLAVVQVLMLYHLVCTRAELVAGVDPRDWHVSGIAGADWAPHI